MTEKREREPALSLMRLGHKTSNTSSNESVLSSIFAILDCLFYNEG